MRQKRDAGELTRMPPPQEMSASAPFFFSRSGTGVMDRRFLRDTREEDGDGWGNVYHMSFSGKVVDCKSFENATRLSHRCSCCFCFLTHLVFSHHLSMCSVSKGIC